ncbi:MarR family winged helix-turn-helix transcriptional regulator [Paenibacillus sp. NPDC057934]|uniref:MarR family winged helix-turn-helix transcriptional regulator n=1 Tax=Paenibacillus sp. NPDC057934 TaxID=3346282 RepID=UPI0036DE10FE
MEYQQHRNKPREELELELGIQINALISSAHALNVRAANLFDSSIQPAAFHIIRWLYSYGATSAAGLAESTAMDRSSVSRLIKQLESLGYIRREPSPTDGRAILLSLTEYGYQQTTHALKEKETAFYERSSKWNDVQIQDFIQMLKEFNAK